MDSGPRYFCTGNGVIGPGNFGKTDDMNSDILMHMDPQPTFVAPHGVPVAEVSAEYLPYLI